MDRMLVQHIGTRALCQSYGTIVRRQREDMS
jgi:hypothetical protein